MLLAAFQDRTQPGQAVEPLLQGRRWLLSRTVDGALEHAFHHLDARGLHHLVHDIPRSFDFLKKARFSLTEDYPKATAFCCRKNIKKMTSKAFPKRGSVAKYAARRERCLAKRFGA